MTIGTETDTSTLNTLLKGAEDDMVCHAFKVGQKVCSTGDSKDTEMYKV